MASSLKADAVHAFFQEVLPAFAALGELVKISESLQDLYQVQSLKFTSHPREAY